MHSVAITLQMTAADTALGRIDKINLSDKMRMELLIEHMPDAFRAMYQNGSQEYLPVCLWAGVECDESDTVVGVSVTSWHAGSVQFQFIPSKVQRFYFDSMHCTGEIVTYKLPEGLEGLIILNGQFGGVFDMAGLPRGLRHLQLASNQFRGVCDCSALPPDMDCLRIPRNAFFGELALQSLPKNMCVVDLSGNAFSGSVTLTSLPLALQRLNIAGNTLTGDVILENLPEGLVDIQLQRNSFQGDFRLIHDSYCLETVFASENDFQGVAVISKELRLEQCFIDLRGSNVCRIVDESGEPHPDEMAIIQMEQKV